MAIKKIFIITIITIFVLTLSCNLVFSAQYPNIPNINDMLSGIDMKYGSPYNASQRNPIFKDFTFNKGVTVTIN